MAHDKIRTAARKRMARTGEPYCVARRRVIEEYKRAARGPIMAGVTLSPVSSALNARALEISRMADQALKAYTTAALTPVSTALNARMLEISRMADQALKAYTTAALTPVSTALNARALEISRIADQTISTEIALQSVHWD
jgi:hypothetical protein